jgi:CDP-diglyceride synthetase
MIKEVIQGYKRLLSLGAKVLGLLGFCLLFAFLLVYPLWRFAVARPEAYSASVLVILGGLLVFLALRRLHLHLARAQSPEERRRLVWGTLRGLCRVGVDVLGVVFFVVLVIQDMKGLAFALIPVVLVIHGMLAFGRKKPHERP